MRGVSHGRLPAILAAGIIAAIGAYLLLNSGTLIRAGGPEVAYYRSSAFFPRLCLAMLVIFALCSVIGEWRRSKDYALVWWPFRYLALLIGYAALVPLLGYLPATLVFLFVSLLLGGLRPVAALLVALATGLILYLLFDVALDVWFPQSALSKLLSGGN